MESNLVKALCEWVWNGFTDVDDIEEKNWILDRLELA